MAKSSLACSVLLWFLLLTFISAAADDIVAAPFFVRRDEGGELVVMVVYGSEPFERVPVYCRRRRNLVAQGPGLMQCIQTKEDDEYDLLLPFQFVRNDHGDITSVAFDDPEGTVISFRLRETSEGLTIAEPFERDDTTDTTSSNLRIPYTIEVSEDGNVVAIVFDDDDDKDEETIVVPMNFILSGDGSRVIGVSFEPSQEEESKDKDTGIIVDLGILGIVLGLLVLILVGFYLKQRNENSCSNDDDDVGSAASEDDLDKDDEETTADFDDMETIPVL